MHRFVLYFYSFKKALVKFLQYSDEEWVILQKKISNQIIIQKLQCLAMFDKKLRNIVITT